MSNRLKLLRDRATRPRRTVPVQLDGEVREQVQAVENALDRLEGQQDNGKRLNSRANSERDKLLAELEHLHESAQETTLYVVVEGLPGRAYELLANQHPPRKGDDGKVLPSDVLGVNAETFRRPVIRACAIGHRETDDAAAPVLPFEPTTRDDDGNVVQLGTLDWLLGTDDEPGFATDRQIERLAVAAITVNRGDDAVPLRRPRSATGMSAEG